MNPGYQNTEFWAKRWGLPVEAVRHVLFAAIQKWYNLSWEDAVFTNEAGELDLERLFCVQMYHEQPLKDIVAKWIQREADRAAARAAALPPVAA